MILLNTKCERYEIEPEFEEPDMEVSYETVEIEDGDA